MRMGDFRIHHTMLPVADLDRSIAFYTGHLGMKVMGRRIDQSRNFAVGHVGYGDRDTHPSLELTQDLNETAPAEPGPIDFHVGIQVGDLQTLCAALEKGNVSFTRGLKASGPDNPRLTAWIRDPDGNAIELIEIRAA
jgi:lactoylglutathione lyase